MPYYNGSSVTYSNANLNPAGSAYASTYGHNTSTIVQEYLRRMLFDIQPQQYLELALLNRKPPQISNSGDEFSFLEYGYQRQPLTAVGTALTATYPATQTFTVSSTDYISVDTIIAYPNNDKGNVVAVNTATKQITVTPFTNQSVPAVAVNDKFANISPIMADMAEGFKTYFRLETSKETNYIMLLSSAVKFGLVEMQKIQSQGSVDNYISTNWQEMIRQFRTSMSNLFWYSDGGEVKLADGTMAKSTKGVWTSMVEKGAPYTSCVASTLKAAFQDVAQASEYGPVGATRFVFAKPKILLALCEAYKTAGTQYKPDDMTANLGLNYIDLLSSKYVLVPMARFSNPASFPPSFDERMFILDMENISSLQMAGFSETMGKTPNILSNGEPKFFDEQWIFTSFGVECLNPLGNASLTVTL